MKMLHWKGRAIQSFSCTVLVSTIAAVSLLASSINGIFSFGSSTLIVSHVFGGRPRKNDKIEIV